MRPVVIFPPRTAHATDMAWVTDAAKFLGQTIESKEDWILLGAQLRGIDDGLAALWWSMCPESIVHSKEMVAAHSTPGVRDPCAYEWLRLRPAHGGGMFGLWKLAQSKGWRGMDRNPAGPTWNHLEELVAKGDKSAFVAEQWSSEKGFRLLQEMSTWFTITKNLQSAMTADTWSHGLLHSDEVRKKMEKAVNAQKETFADIRKKPTAAPRKKKANASKASPAEAEAGPSAPAPAPAANLGFA